MTPPSDSRAPHEEGFSKDADKLIRRLSLVAFLLSRRGRPATAAEIRRRVEGYSLMTDEAFKRRFYEDRAELAELGVAIDHDEEDGEADLYALPAEGFYLPAIQFTADETAALAACLFVLGDRFVYSEPLRLALLSLTHGRPPAADDDVAAPVSVLPEPDARRAAAALPRVQQAIAARKAVVFTYYAIGRDEELERTVDPYSLLVVGDEWYLIGHCHLRGQVRTFRLSRIRSRVTYATRAPHDFAAPDRFALADYVDRPAWQLGPATRTATIRVSPDMAWWVEAHFAHCGTVAPRDDGSIVYETAYTGSRQLAAWVLSMGDEAEVVAPPDLRAEVRAGLDKLRGLLAAPPAAAAAFAGGGGAAAPPPPRRRARRDTADWEVEVDRFTRLATLMTYLYDACRRAGGGDETPLSVAETCAALDLERRELRDDVRLLNLVNFGADGTLLWGELKGETLLVTCDPAARAFDRPARLSPLQVDTLLLAVELLGGQLPTRHGQALGSAAAKLRAARQGAPPALAAADPLPPHEAVLDAVNAAIRERRVLHIEYWSQGTGKTSERDIEPALLLRTRGEWYVVGYCRRSRGIRVFRVATTKRATLGDEHFVPRDDVELDVYRREGIRASAQYAHQQAVVWYGPAVARWIAERESVEALPGGACLARQPYLDDRWLVHEMLRFAGEAVPLAPPQAVAALGDTVALLLQRYPAG